MQGMIQPFEFMQSVSLIKTTGRKAKDLRELWAGIGGASNESIFHHTYQYFLKGHMLEYTNDFAHWAGESLEERMLAEQLSSVDPYEFADIPGLRSKLMDVIDDYLKVFPEPREVIHGNEFYFTEAITIVFRAGIMAHNLAEFLIAIRYVDAGSLYYHLYDARQRLGGRRDDFSEWFEKLGEKELAEKVKEVDPFMHTIEGMREHIIEAVESDVRKDMEDIRQ